MENMSRGSSTDRNGAVLVVKLMLLSLGVSIFVVPLVLSLGGNREVSPSEAGLGPDSGRLVSVEPVATATPTPLAELTGRDALLSLGPFGHNLSTWSFQFPDVTRQEWVGVRDAICSDPESRYLPSGATSDDALANSIWAAAVYTECPEHFGYATDSARVIALQSFQSWYEHTGGELPTPVVVGTPSPPKGPVTGGSGYRVMCRDGTFSNAGGKQGACSHHGGVS